MKQEIDYFKEIRIAEQDEIDLISDSYWGHGTLEISIKDIRDLKVGDKILLITNAEYTTEIEVKE